MNSKVKVFGKNPDGTVGTICKAKPENMGKGRCKHVEHIEFTLEELHNGIIEKTNEKALGAKFQKGLRKSGETLPNVTQDKIQTTKNGFYISKEELNKAASETAQVISNEDWQFIKEFSRDYRDQVDNSPESSKVIENLSKYLESDSENSTRVRDFLGSEIDLQEFSTLIVQESHSMTNSVTWSPGGRNSVRRAFLTSIHNDMNKERYIASVLFFGGRCCYCNTTLKRAGKTRKSGDATGEHLSPISPENPGEPTGGTRFGNMALACHGCNEKRGNQELVSWIQETKRIPKKEKGKALGRILAFRKYALYSDYTPKESKIIDRAVEEVNDKIAKNRNSAGLFESEAAISHCKTFSKSRLYDLKIELEGTQ